MLTEEELAQGLIAQYRSIISNTPDILSLLYDADLLPEQLVSVRGAISMAAVVEAYKLGKGITND